MLPMITATMPTTITTMSSILKRDAMATPRNENMVRRTSVMTPMSRVSSTGLMMRSPCSRMSVTARSAKPCKLSETLMTLASTKMTPKEKVHHKRSMHKKHWRNSFLVFVHFLFLFNRKRKSFFFKFVILLNGKRWKFNRWSLFIAVSVSYLKDNKMISHRLLRRTPDRDFWRS